MWYSVRITVPAVTALTGLLSRGKQKSAVGKGMTLQGDGFATEKELFRISGSSTPTVLGR
jgi:hypothetical protein